MMAITDTTDTKRRSSGARLAAHSALDVMLTDAVVDQGGARRFVRPMATARVATGLARHPTRVARRARGLGRELATAVAGQSEIAPAKGDRRFSDRAWQENWLLRRLLQS
jgi:poly[(R)-3-hydroxyalkanoate] polymerase subunit PhaC